MNKDTKDLISIIVPVYNVESYIMKCLDSISNQTYTNFEVLLIDDGSTDRSGAICDEYSTSDKRFMAYHQKNCGVSSARNFALSRIRGNYVMFVDSDDFIHPQMLEILYVNLNSGDYDFSMCDYVQVHSDYEIDGKIDNNLKTEDLDSVILIQRLFGIYEHTGIYNVGWNKLFKKSIIGNNLFKSFSEAEDIEFNCRIYCKTTKAVYLDIPLYYYVQRDLSVTHEKVTLKKIDATNAFFECYKDLAGYDKLQSYSLVRLYKRLLSLDYASRNTDYHKPIKKVHNEIVRQTRKDFLTNKYITLFSKMTLLISYYFPLPYYFLRDLLELKFRINNN